MAVALFVDFKRTRRGGSSRPGGYRGKRKYSALSSRGQAANHMHIIIKKNSFLRNILFIPKKRVFF